MTLNSDNVGVAVRGVADMKVRSEETMDEESGTYSMMSVRVF